MADRGQHTRRGGVGSTSVTASSRASAASSSIMASDYNPMNVVSSILKEGERGERDAIAGPTIICAVTENRAREICIATINTSNCFKLDLHIVTDSHSYIEALSALSEIQPNEILLPDSTKKKNILTGKIVEWCEQEQEGRVIFISRQYFDQDRGAELLKKILVGKADQDLIAKYTVRTRSPPLHSICVLN
jgi:DNA mismatch repair ATPase MutS